MFNVPRSGPVYDLVNRAGGRVEILVHFSNRKGYELVDWNRPAVELFDLPIPQNDHLALPWGDIPVPLAEYLAEALQMVSGAPEEAMPALRSPLEEQRSYFSKVFYTREDPTEEDDEEHHWYYFCFQDSVNWLDTSNGMVNQKKLETIGELASGVAHDFNNLIMGIQSNAEAMLAQASMSPQMRDSLINIIRACSTGASLTRSLLGYAKRQPLTMARFNVCDLVHDVARIAGVAGVASGNHRIILGKELEDKSEPIMVNGSFSSLSHCLLNLIKNAREAMPGGGTINVLWEGDDETARVTVRDHGAGISEQDMAHIFEPFYSTKKQGTGLGLAMVRGILQQHAGTVEIRSTLGMGTSVSLVWPRGDVSAGAPRSKDATDTRRSTKRIFRQSQRIMLQAQRASADSHFMVYVIDDDDLVRDGLCSLLEHLGHRTQSYSQPEIALKALLSADPPPDIVIVDYNMPGMNGTQFISTYATETEGQERFLSTSMLLMSGLPPSHFHDFMSEFTRLKIGVLEKPFSLETLRRKISNVKGTRRLSGGLSKGLKLMRPPEPLPQAERLKVRAKNTN